MCFISTYSILNTLSEYTYFYVSKNFTSYTFSFVFINVQSLNQNFWKTFYFLLQMRRNFSLVTRYSLKVTRWSLIVAKLSVTCCKICSLLVTEVTRCWIRLLLVAEVARCKNSLVTRWKICSLQKITRYSLQNLLVAKNNSLLVAKNYSSLLKIITSP